VERAYLLDDLEILKRSFVWDLQDEEVGVCYPMDGYALQRLDEELHIESHRRLYHLGFS
jgi:hypothetical protein